MNLYFGKNKVLESYVHIRDLNTLDLLCEDKEAVNIIVDNYLTQFSYQNLGGVLNKIVSKLRKNGTIIVSELDLEFTCYQLTRGFINQEQFNDIVFENGPVSGIFNTETICDLLKMNGLKINEKFIDANLICNIRAQR